MERYNVSYSPLYSASRALVIGINKYEHAPPLGYATSDAQSFAQLLEDHLDFPEEDILLLTDERATRQAIMESYLAYASQDVGPDDRIVFFFAGHGHTITGSRGEVGYLVPYEGNQNDLSTLIRWDEFTRNADLIPAKHMLFVMDACYGGLAIMRSLPPGSIRFLKDMLLRHSRQVLTAGKADEVVADSGGPLTSHSIFTGHLIEALEGKAASAEGIITANGVMAYVYERVARDHHSSQTPHYGFIDGDGDMIFKAPILDAIKTEAERDQDVLVAVPSTTPAPDEEEPQDIVERTKQYLSDPKDRIRLHDLVARELRQVLLLTSEDGFAVQGTEWSLDEFRRRLHQYEVIVRNLQSISCCISYWGEQQHAPTLRTALIRPTDRLESQSGVVVWIGLRWYPVLLLLYTSGIAALAAEKYDNLATIMLSKVGSSPDSRSTAELTLAVGEGILSLERSGAFKQLPGHERQYVPRSEYLFKLLQPILDDLLFLGRDYERLFDRFETMLALVHVDLERKGRLDGWGPIGRFGWKYHYMGEGANPLTDLIIEAAKQKESWPPLKAGLFGGEYSRFAEAAAKFKEVVANLGWR